MLLQECFSSDTADHKAEAVPISVIQLFQFLSKALSSTKLVTAVVNLQVN